MDGGIRLQNLDGVLSGDYAFRDGRLRDVWGLIDGGELCSDRRRVAHRRRSVLILGANDEAESSALRFCAHAGEVVEAGLIGTAVVVDDGLAEVKTVVQDLAVDLTDTGVGAG